MTSCALDCTFAEFEAALERAVVIEETALVASSLKELILTIEWKHPLHVVVVVDPVRREERIVTVYQPNPRFWSPTTVGDADGMRAMLSR